MLIHQSDVVVARKSFVAVAAVCFKSGDCVDDSLGSGVVVARKSQVFNLNVGFESQVWYWQ